MTTIPITSQGRALCGFRHAKTNSVNTNKVRNGGWKDSGVADKMSHVWNWGTLRPWDFKKNSTPPHFVLLRGERRGKKTINCERFHFLWEQLRPSSSYLSRKCHKTWTGLQKKKKKKSWKVFLLFCPFPATGSDLAGIWEYQSVYLSWCRRQQWEEVTFDWNMPQWIFFFFFKTFFESPCFPPLHLFTSLCVGLAVNTAVSMVPFLFGWA